MELSELKELAQEGEQLNQGREFIYCEVCDCKREQWVTTYTKVQIRDCRGYKRIIGHTLYYDPKGQYLWAVAWSDGREDWRVKFDRARTEGDSHWKMAWDKPRRVGGRHRKDGKAGRGGYFTEYVNPDEEE